MASKKSPNATLSALRRGLRATCSALRDTVRDVRVAHAKAVLRSSKK